MSMTPAQQAVMTQINSITGLAEQLMAALQLIIPVMQQHNAQIAKTEMTAMQTALSPHAIRMREMADDTAQMDAVI